MNPRENEAKTIFENCIGNFDKVVPGAVIQDALWKTQGTKLILELTYADKFQKDETHSLRVPTVAGR